MKKLLSFFTAVLLLTTVGYSQLAQLPANFNAVSAQEPCKTDILLQQQLNSDPAFLQQFNNYKLQAKNAVHNKATLYTIPIVIHIIHLGESVGTGSNISDAQIHSAINNLNQAYRNQAPYTGVDMELEFCLASVDPSGNPTSGINRVDGSGTSDYSTQGITNDGGSSLNETDVKALSNWGNTDYYQFWVVAGIDGNMGGGGVQGYAYFITSAARDGAVVLYNSFGYDPTGTLCYNLKGYTNRNVTTIHEVGHALGVYHTFQGDGTGSTCPTNGNCATDGDEVCDTPPHLRSVSDCDIGGTNTCTGGSKDLYIHNFMDYSSDECQTEFTADQKTKARNWLLAARPSLTTSVKCNPVAVPVSEFTTVCGAQSGCVGTSVDFFDLSEGNPSGWSWTFTGGTPASSSAQYPSVTYSSPGTYAVSLTATNSFGTGAIETKNGFITIFNSPTAACIPPTSGNEGFAHVISNVTFNTINNSTSTSSNLTYTDFACSKTTEVTEGLSYNLSVDYGAANFGFDEELEVYIDWNDDGVFDPAELVLSGNTPANTTNNSNTNIVIPGTAIQNKLLRMRVFGEATTLTSTEIACGSTMFVPDVEDYGIYINPASVPPVADFSGAPTIVCEGAAVTFADLSTNTPTGWSWVFTGGTPAVSTAQNPVITYNTNGVYQVELTATNASGSDIETKVGYITVNVCGSAPVAEFSGSPTVVCEGFSVNFTDLSTNTPTGWSWTFAGGTPSSSSSQNPIITYNSAGTYQVELTASNGFGSDIETKLGYITVNACGLTQLHVGYRKTYVAYTQKVACNAVASAQEYEFEFTPSGGGGSIIYNRGIPNISFLLGWVVGLADATTYDVRVRPKIGGSFGSFGSTYQLTTPSVTTNTSVSGSFCGKVYSSYSEQLNCYSVVGATDYEFEFTPSGGGASVTYNRGSASNSILLNMVTGLIDNTLYDVRVRAFVGSWGSYGTICKIQTPVGTATTNVVSGHCGKVYSSMGQALNCYSVTGATDYEWEFTPSAGGAPITYNRGLTATSILLNMVPGLALSTQYDVRVRPELGGSFGTFGSMCQITTGASAKYAINDKDNTVSYHPIGNMNLELKMKVYPNPSQGNFVYLDLQGLSDDAELFVTDIFGKTIVKQPIESDYGSYNETLRFNQKLDAGFYLITIISGNQKMTKKLIVR